MNRLGLRRIATTLGVAAIALTLAGCSGGVQLPAPELQTYQNIAITPFIYKTDRQFGMLVSRDLGNQLQIGLKQKSESADAYPQVIFDESADRKPISDALTQLNITLEDAYANPKLAGKVAAALGAGVIVVGQIRELRIITNEDDRPVYDMSAFGGTSKSDTRYTITYQDATTKLSVKMVDAAGTVIWQTGSTPPKEPGTLTGHLKYAKAFQVSSVTKDAVPEGTIIAHMRDHIWRLVAYELYPGYFPLVKIPVWKEKPTQRFKASGGEVRFD
ncbi:MAG: hypothetical protein O3A46_13785 [Candidatus Poribacteria bacterium]|nr:hypothetical protein [Candidatus Poribacteria bacterium]